MKYLIILLLFSTQLFSQTLPDRSFILKRATTADLDKFISELSYNIYTIGVVDNSLVEFNLNNRYGISDFLEINVNLGYAKSQLTLRDFFNRSTNIDNNAYQLGLGGKYNFANTDNSKYSFVSNFDITTNDFDTFYQILMQLSKYNEYKWFDIGFNFGFQSQLEDITEQFLIAVSVPATIKIYKILINFETGAIGYQFEFSEGLFFNGGVGVRFTENFIGELNIRFGESLTPFDKPIFGLGAALRF